MKRKRSKAPASEPDFDKPSSGDAADLNMQFRKGGKPVEDRDQIGRDLCGDMELARHRPDVLANDLRAMGITPNGDEPEDEP